MVQEIMDQLDGMAADKVNEVHTILVGRVKTFDANTSKADIEVYGKYDVNPDDEEPPEEYPILTDVPVVMPGIGKDVSIAYPVAKGDDVLVFICENDYDNWLFGSDAEGATRYDLTNALFLPHPLKEGNADLKEACSDKAVVIRNKSTKMVVKSSGVEITGDVTVKGKITVSGDVTAGGISLMHHTHTGVHGGTTAPN